LVERRRLQAPLHHPAFGEKSDLSKATTRRARPTALAQAAERLTEGEV
jgi:hypothetical protein